MDYDLLFRFYRAGAKFTYVPHVLGCFRTGGINERQRLSTIREVRQIALRHQVPNAKATKDCVVKTIKYFGKTLLPSLIRSNLERQMRSHKGMRYLSMSELATLLPSLSQTS
jgi:hypothetical protein